MPTAASFELNLPVSFITEGNQVVAYTPALDISTSGKDEAEAKARFSELVAIFFKDLAENNTVDAVLSELGWQKVAQQWNPPVVSQQSLSVRVPVFA
jgi:predicted RNase H-like HicB family nuclease